jgi:hypothetical protein
MDIETINLYYEYNLAYKFHILELDNNINNIQLAIMKAITTNDINKFQIYKKYLKSIEQIRIKYNKDHENNNKNPKQNEINMIRFLYNLEK